MRVILDTNVIASGLASLRPDVFPPARILQAWLDQSFTVFISEPMMAEVARTLEKPYFIAHVPPERRIIALSALQEAAVTLLLTTSVSGVATHPEDDLVLATAISAQADYLVTGDRQLLKLGSFEGVAIISPAGFLDVLGGQDNR